MTENNCIHCGLDCGKYPVLKNGELFCCEGCATVYYLLQDNKLYTYYNLDKNPGIRIDIDKNPGKYAFLDHPEVKDKLMEFSDNSISKIRLYIPSIHCSSCIWLLENLNRLNNGIIQSTVHFGKKEVGIAFKDQLISLRQVVELLVSIHYVPEITLESLENKGPSEKPKQLIYKIGIAGFAFGNIMLFTMPYYIPGKELIDDSFKYFFTWLNLILSLPVVFYCGNEYLLSAFKNLRKGIVNINLPIAIGILALLIQSLYETVFKTGHGYYDSLTGLIFFLLIGKWYQEKTYRYLSFEREYKSYFPVAVSKLTDGFEENTLLKDLKPDDHILIRNQELIPADSVLVKGDALIDYSFITGESNPVMKEKGDLIFAGGRQTGSIIELKISKDVEQSHLTRIWNEADVTIKGKTNLQSLIDIVSHRFTIIIISIAVFTALVWLFINPEITLKAATAVLIVACPCALALAIPFASGNTMRLFGKKSFYLKRADVIEKLAGVDSIVFDKTGTLTRHGDADVTFMGDELNEQERLWISSVAASSLHPLSKVIREYLGIPPSLHVYNFEEISNSGIRGICENKLLTIGSEVFVTGKKGSGNHPAGSYVYVSIDQRLRGNFVIRSKYRDGFNSLISELKDSYDLYLISGDQDAEKQFLKNSFPEQSMLFYQSPEDKLHFIRNLQSNGRKVLMIGDGLNDAGALRESNVGISIADNIFQFSPACDAILDGKNFGKLGSLLTLCKNTMQIVRISFIISFLYNVVGISFAVRGMLSPVIAAVLMPMSSVSVVAFVTLLTSWTVKKLHKDLPHPATFKFK